MLWNEKRYCRYLSVDATRNRRIIDPVIVFSGTVFRWALWEHSAGVFSPVEFLVRDNLPYHEAHMNRLANLNSGERARYDDLVDSILTRGTEMGGLTDLVQA